jgi:hypothetical protein
VLVDASELDVGFLGIRDDQAVYEAFRDGLGQCMAQETLHLHGCAAAECGCRFRPIDNVIEARLTEQVEGHWGLADNIRCPAINQFV